jgi:uncharacterized damage-inducible protein DinB
VIGVSASYPRAFMPAFLMESARRGVDMVSEPESLQKWFAYIAAARQGYIGTFEKLPPGELSRDRGASFPSLLDILAHSQGALYFWIRNCSPTAFPPPEPETDEPPTIAQLKAFETYLQAHVQRFVGALGESDLDRVIARPKGPGSDHDCNIPVREILWHLVEEELQHLGELNALLWQIDVEAPVYNWIRWAHDVGRIQDLPSK